MSVGAAQLDATRFTIPLSDDRPGSSVSVSRPREGVAVVAFAGEHDLTTKSETEALLGQLINENDRVVVDLCAATFIDSTFLNCLLTAERQAIERQAEFVLLVRDAPNITAVLKASGLEQRLTIITSRDEN